MIKARHKKTGKTYSIMSHAIDCTNSRDGEKVAIYTDGKKVFVREIAEFNEKFEEAKQ